METYLYQDLDELENTHFWHLSKRKTALSLLRPLFPHRNITILDIGCGTGGNIKPLSSLGSVHGVDASPAAVSFCHRKGLKRIIQASAENLPFKNQTFNLITLFDVLEHINEKKSLLEIHRVLKKGGFLLLTVPAYPWLWSRWDEALHHKRRYTKTRLEKVLLRLGLNPFRSSYFFSFLLPPMILTRLVKSFFFKKYYLSDFRLSSPLINRLLIFLADVERPFMHLSLVPFGSSIICLAQKR